MHENDSTFSALSRDVHLLLWIRGFVQGEAATTSPHNDWSMLCVSSYLEITMKTFSSSFISGHDNENSRWLEGRSTCHCLQALAPLQVGIKTTLCDNVEDETWGLRSCWWLRGSDNWWSPPGTVQDANAPTTVSSDPILIISDPISEPMDTHGRGCESF